MESDQSSGNGHRPREHEGHGLGRTGAVALGVAAVAAGRAVYKRARKFDLAEAGERVEDRLNR